MARLGLGNLPRSRVIGVDPYALLFALLVTLGTSLAVAWAPAALFSKLDLHSTLKSAGRGGAGIAGRSRFRPLLVSEVSLAMVLLVAAGLLLRSFWAVEHVNPGFRPDHLLTAYLRTNDYGDARSFFPELVERAAGLPGVEVSAVSKCILGEGSQEATIAFSDRPDDPYHRPEVSACWISPDFFRAIGTPVLQGRAFSARDNAEGLPVVIVNDALARTYWPGADAIGKQITVDFVGGGRSASGAQRFRQVVGVVANIKQNGLDSALEPALYTPYLQDETNHAFAGMDLLLRTRGEPRTLASAVRAQVHAISPRSAGGQHADHG